MTPEALTIETLFKIVNKAGEDIPFELNEPQKQLDDELTGRDIVPKARQRGVSSYFLGRYVAACIIKRNVRAVVISHETEATQRLLNRCHYFVNNTRGPRPSVGRSGLNVLAFPKTNSEIYIGTAGSRAFGRGDTITHLLCSEYAYWPNPTSLLSGLLDAVPYTGEVVLESTGNGTGNDYHRRSMRAAQGQSQWKCHFLSWLDASEYSIELTADDEAKVMDSLDEELEEPDLVKDYGLTAGQVVWRRMKLEEKDYDLRLFKQEFPITLDECFQASGNSLFWKVNFTAVKEWKKQDSHLHVLDPHPIAGMSYVLGADPAGGTGGDNSCVEIFCLNTQEQVAEWAYNRLEPDVFGDKIFDLATMFNSAYIVVESNNHGPVTLSRLRDLEYPFHLMYEAPSGGATGGIDDVSLMRMGFRTTARSKPIMIGKLRRAVAGDWTIHSELLSDEMSTFIEHPTGSIGAETGCHDDRVIAAACAMMGIDYAALYVGAARSMPTQRGLYKDPFLLDNIVDEMAKRGRGSPISPQHAGSWRIK